MRRLLGLAVVALFLLLAAPAFAQSGRLTIVDTTGDLDQGRIEQAARSLVNQGAKVAVYLVNSEGGADDFQQRLEAAGLANGQQLDTNLVAVYVSLNPRYSELAGGDRWNAALSTNNAIETIRTTTLNPALSSGDYSAAFVNTLGAIDTAISNPPVAGGGTVFNINFLPLVIGGFALLALVVGGGAAVAWRSTARTLAAARERYDQRRKAAAAAIADMGQALNSAQEKAQFDALSYTAVDAQRIGATQRQIETAFQQAQIRFDDVGEQFEHKATPQVADYNGAADAYEQIQHQVAEQQGDLAAIEAQRKELDALALQAPQEIDRAKKA